VRRSLFLAAALALAGAVTPARAEDRVLDELHQTLRRLDQEARGPETADDGTALREKVQALLQELERRDRAMRQEFAAAGRQALPSKARERLARTQAAYEAGHGRLIRMLRAAAQDRASDRGDRLRESMALLARIRAAARRPPLSAGELKVKAPDLAAPALAQPAELAAIAGEDEPLGPIPPVLKSQAAALAGPVEAYEWVRNEVAPELYHGVRKGPVSTLREGRGNDADTAGLLIALLRAKGIPARYVRGTVELPAALAASMAGTATAELALRAFERAGFPHEAVTAAAGIASVKVERVWVEAYLPYANYRGEVLDAQEKVWVPLDPGFKRLSPPRGLDVVTELGFDGRAFLDEYLQSPHTESPLESARGRVASLLSARRPDLTMADVPNSRALAAQSLGLLPASLPYKVLARAEVSYAAPLQHTVRFVAESAGASVLDETFPLADLLGERLTLSYVPFSEDDEAVAKRYGGMLQTPPYLIEVKPVLKRGGVVIATGSAGIGLGVTYSFRLRFTSPGGSDEVTNEILAGNLTAIALAPGEGADASEGEAARILFGLASRYLERWDQADGELADLLHVIPVRPTVSMCLVQSAFEVDYAGGDPLFPIRFDWKGIAIDADRRPSAPVGVFSREGENDFSLLSGLQGSVLESRIFEDALQIPSVSTAPALQLAPGQGIPVLAIDRTNLDVLAGLPLDESVVEEIQEAAGRGFHVRVPARPLTFQAWTGVGYLILDEETGETAWQLQGGHSGGVTAPAVINLPVVLVDALRQQGESPADEPGAVTAIQKYSTTDFQFGTVDKDLAKPLKVLVTDEQGYPVPGAPVTFTVLGGGAELRDPATGRASANEVTVLSCAADALVEPCKSLKPGEAVAFLRLGRKTSLIPRFFCEDGLRCTCPEGEICEPASLDHFTQVGVNLVTARAGAVVLAEPFTAIGMPDDRFDGQNRFVDVALGTAPQFPPFANLTVPDRLNVAVTDQHGNPISNASIRIAFRPPPTLIPAPPGKSLLRGPTTTPGHILKPADYERCVAQSPSVVYGQCPGEAEAVVQRSSSLGVDAYPLLGDSPFSLYYYDFGTVGTPPLAYVAYPTTGFVCHNPDPTRCGFGGGQPVLWPLAGTRGTLANSLGNHIEAYAPGGQGLVGLWSDAIYEGVRIEKTTDAKGKDHFKAFGTNTWERKHLEDTHFALTPRTSGTQVSPATPVYLGQGKYQSTMTMGLLPQLNTVGIETQAFPEDLRYLPDHLDEVDPTTVDPVTLVAAKFKDFERPYRSQDSFSLWGAEAAITAVVPSPLLVDSVNTLTRSSAVRHEIRPAEYGALLAPRDVRFEVKPEGGATPVLAANGLAQFEIPAGLSLPQGSYFGQIRLLGVSSNPDTLSSSNFMLAVCRPLDLLTPHVEVALVRDVTNDVVCGSDQQLAFALCRYARVTIDVEGATLSASVDGGAPQPLSNLLLGAGVHRVRIDPGILGLGLDSRATFTVRAVDAADPALVSTADGEIVNALQNRSVMPVGHTFAKGIDLLDGHVVQSSTDLKISGRHLGLEVLRTYSSAGRSASGVLGAGWAFNYGSRLSESSCGLVNVITPDGSSQLFRTIDGGLTFKPQKGYHTRLVRNADLSYDFFDKADLRHHFREPADPTQPQGERRLEYLEEPHGDRIVLHYDGAGRVVRVAEAHPEAGEVRWLELTYRPVFGFDRISGVASPALKLTVTYDYDTYGNLVTATRSGENLPGFTAAAPRIERYEYSIGDGSDRHQMVAAVGPNGERTEFRYFKTADAFPGESAFTAVDHKEEFAKEVLEFPSTGQTLSTRFAYDYSDVLSHARFKATVRDPRGHDTLNVLNGNGSALEIHEPLGKTSVMEWAATDILKMKETNPLGRITEYGYDDRGNLTLETIHTADLGDAVTTYEYDPRFNKLTFKRDAEGRETRYSIDPASGDLTDTTDAVADVTTYVYDTHGRLTSSRDPRGHTASHADHDSFGNPRTVTDALGNVTTSEYDARGRLTHQADTMGHEARTAYDGLDRPLQAVRVAGGASDDKVTTTSYYAGGQARTITNANGAVTTYTLDGLNRVTATSTALPGETLTTGATYDGNGNLVTQTDRRGVTRRNTYDELDRLQRVEIVAGVAGEGPTGQVAAYEYDLAGNKTFETNVAGLTTGFLYDGLYEVREKRLTETNPATNKPYTETYVHDRVGNQLATTDANGHTTTLLYDGRNRVLRTTNAVGQSVTATYLDPEGSHVNKSEEHDETRGLRTSYLYDALNRETRREVKLEGAGANGEVYTTATAYDDQAHAATVTDPRGIPTRTALDGLDHIVEQTVEPGGLALVTHMAYDGLGNRKSVVDPESHRTTFAHDGLGRLVETTDALGHVFTSRYDGEGLRISATDRRNVTRSFTFDNLGRLRLTAVLAVASMSGVPWSHEVRYFDVLRQRVEIDARGYKTIFDLDSLDRVVKETDARAKFRTFRWDGVNKREETDKRPRLDGTHNTTLFGYDPLNRLTLVTNALGQTIVTEHDDLGNRIIETDRRTIRKVSQMDPLGRLLSVTRAQGIPEEEAVLERSTYDPNSNKLTSTDADNHVTKFIYDPANRLKSRTDGFGSPEPTTTTYEYDRAGNQTEERDQRAADLGEPFSLKKTYDELNRLETATDGEAHVTRYGYDNEGNRTSLTDQLGQVTTYEYDELGKLTKVMQPTVPLASGGTVSPVTSYVYDKSRNRTLQTDANQHAVKMDYDELNRLTALTQDPGGFDYITGHEYDENGNETVLTDPKGQKVTSTYDELNRLHTKTYAFAPSDSDRPWRHLTGIVYTYDPNDNLQQVAETVASGTDPPVVLTTTRDHNNLDRLKAETSPLPDGGERTVAYTYYRNGSRKTLTDPAGLTTFYEYDGQNRLKATTTGFGTPDPATTTQTYWPDDLLKTVTHPNGVTATYGYDKADRLTSLVNERVDHLTQARTPVSSYAYTYDANGNRLSQVETNGGAPETTGYTYDALNRLETVTYPDKQVAYGYDAVGNRQRETERDLIGTVTSDKTAAFDALNRPLSLTDPVAPANDTSFTWDRNGNQLTKTVGTGPAAVTTAYHYDIRDKLVEVNQGAGTLGRYQYCYDGNRTKKIGEDGIRQYVYDQTSLLTEYDATGLEKAKYDYGSDRLISLTRTDEGRRYFSLDGLRSVVNLTADNGSTVASYHLDAWGNFRFPQELDASKNRFAFTGHIFDEETGLYNAKARYFDPKLGRFLTQDSYLGQNDNPPSLHRYFYAAQNPTKYVDPSGHAFTDAELREIGRQFNQRTGPLQKDTTPDYKKGWWTNAVETFSYEFTGRLFSPGFKTYQGLKNMSQLGGEDPSLFIEGQAETVISAAVPLVVKEGGGALLDKVPALARVLRKDVGEWASSAFAKGKEALEGAATRLKGLFGEPPPGGNSLVPATGIAEPLPSIPGTAGGTRPIAGGSQGADAASAQGGPITDPARMLPAGEQPAGLLAEPSNTRLPQDAAVNPRAPQPRPLNRPIGSSPGQAAELNADIRAAHAEGATDIRVNQQQLDAAGNRVGIDRPDLQYTKPDGTRVHIEYDRPSSGRGIPHADRILANDPEAVVETKTIR